MRTSKEKAATNRDALVRAASRPAPSCTPPAPRAGEAALVGAQAVARAAAKGDPALSERVLRAARQVIGEAILARPG